MAYFKPYDKDHRAQKRIQGEDVFGNKIKVTPTLRNYTARREKGDALQCQQFPSRGASQESRRYSHDQDHPIRPVAGTPSQDPNPGLTRRSRVSPYENHSFLSSNRSRGNSGSSEYSDDARTHSDSATANQPVDLIISNLDYSINIKELKKMLMNMREHAAVLSLNVDVQNDGFPVARIRASNQQAAQFIISQLHHQKWGHRKMVVSYARNNSPNPEQLRAVVISILQEVPDHMPLFKFMELLEHRYSKISVSEVSKLKDICQITENQGSRVISLTQSIKVSPPPNLSQTLVPYCTIHTNILPNPDWCETNISPSITASLKTFAPKLEKLLTIHMGCIPLYTFQNCYEQEYQEPLPVDDNGVLLEHMITCVSNVEIQKYAGLSKNFKVIKRGVKIAELDGEAFLKPFPPSLASNISLFCREVVELLKSKDNCQLLVNKFIPAYHQYFSRQCHVATYGFTKLVDLLEAISHVVQIAGDGPHKIVTLTHQTQMRRFTSDLLRVLKVQPFKQITETDFPIAYEKVMSKPFNPVNYGLCTFQDLLEEIPANIIVITQTQEDVVIAIPKREQSPEQIARTKLFSGQVIDILKHAPNFTIMFEKFVPMYHQHFARQCRVADYGFAKLTDLFEAIPHIVKIQELPVVGRTVSLTLDQSLKILGGQVVELLKRSPTSSILLEELPRIYEEKYGYPMKPQVYECETIAEVVGKIHCVQMIPTGAGTLIVISDTDCLSTMKIRSWALLLKPPHCKMFSTFEYEYQSRYNSDISLKDIKKINDVVSLSSLRDSYYIALNDLYILGAQLYHMLYTNGGSVPFKDIEKLYSQKFGEKCNLSAYNMNSLDELYERFDFLFFKRGHMKDVLALNRNLAEHQVPLPAQISNVKHGSKKSPSSFQKPVLSAVKKGATPKKEVPAKTNTTTRSPSQIKEESKLNLPLEWPGIENPQPPDNNPFDLLSPAKPLFFFKRSQWEQAPDPALLPMPNKFIMKNKDESHDSGINSRLETSASEDGTELGACGFDARRLFGNYLNLDE